MPPHILADTDGPVAEVINPGGKAPVLLVCEHASARIPEGLRDLGLLPEHRLSHAVWDPGALDLALTLSDMLDAPLIAARFSRLVWDLNRPFDASDATPARTELIDVPGNRELGAETRRARFDAIYEPFHAKIGAMLDAFPTPPILMTIHSFTPIWFGTVRGTEIGLLHAGEPGLATAMQAARPSSGPSVALNEPYSAADGVTHTIEAHGDARGLSSVMVEVRNDLLTEPGDILVVAETLRTMLEAAMETRP